MQKDGKGMGDTPDVGPSMTLDLRNISQPTHGKPEKLPSKCSSDRFADRRFAHTWRACQADDLAFHGSTKLSDRQKLQNALLDIFQPVMVFIQNPLGVCNRVVLRRVLTPRYLR